MRLNTRLRFGQNRRFGAQRKFHTNCLKNPSTPKATSHISWKLCSKGLQGISSASNATQYFREPEVSSMPGVSSVPIEVPRACSMPKFVPSSPLDISERLHFLLFRVPGIPFYEISTKYHPCSHKYLEIPPKCLKDAFGNRDQSRSSRKEAPPILSKVGSSVDSIEIHLCRPAIESF